MGTGGRPKVALTIMSVRDNSAVNMNWGLRGYLNGGEDAFPQPHLERWQNGIASVLKTVGAVTRMGVQIPLSPLRI